MEPANSHLASQSRRTVLKSGLFGLGVCYSGISGCGQKEGVAQSQEPRRVREFVDSGHRLYGITINSETYPGAEVFISRGLSLLSVFWPGRTDFQIAPPIVTAVWATPEEVETLADVEGIDAVFEKLPEHVVVIGTPESAVPHGETPDEEGGENEPLGMLAVKLLPTPATHPNLGRPCASIAQVIQDWQDSLEDDQQIRIEEGPEPVIPESFGEVADKGQIVIRYSMPTLDSDLLELILNHPQVIGIRWGGLFANLYCPPCGRG